MRYGDGEMIRTESGRLHGRASSGQFRVFKRTWWEYDPKYPGEKAHRVPGAGPKTPLAVVDTIEEAREYCKEWNEEHDPGDLSLKAEFEEV